MEATLSIIETDRMRAQRPCTFPEFLTALNNPGPVFTSVPRSLREHVGYRSFGDFGALPMAERPASADLSDRVARWRSIEAREDLPLQAHPDQVADDRRHRFAFAVTSLTLTSWIIIGVVAAAWSGKL